MNWSVVRKARKSYRCSCGNLIRRGDKYIDHRCTPDHAEVGNVGWWRSRECSECANRYGRTIEVSA